MANNGNIEEVTEDMGMLKSISLENYKCFKKKTDIDIAPLTVLCGVNSSGKSSILKSLLMLKQSYENESPTHSMLLSGEYTDNGSFDDIVYHTSKDQIHKDACFVISNSFLIKDTSNEYGKNLVKRQDIASYKELKKVFMPTNLSSKIKCFNIKIDIEVQRPEETDSPFEFYIESNIIKSYKISIILLDIDEKEIDKSEHFINVTKNIVSNDDNDNNGWILNWKGIPSIRGNSVPGENYYCTCYFSGLQIKNIYANNMTIDVRNVLPNLLSIFKIASFQTDGLSFIAPLRQHPARRYSINGDVDSVGISGEKTPILLAKEFENKKMDAIPPKERINKNNKGILHWGKQRLEFNELVQKWMNYLSLGNLSLSGKNGLVEINIDNHNIVDVGFGVSQALPILVQGLYLSKDQSLLLEQPEIHLHPEMQLQMADFLIALANNEKNVIVETHSDHFVNRIIHRVMQNYDELNKIVKIYIVEKDEDANSSTVRLKEINKYKGTEKDKSKFFFTQYDSEITDIVDTGLNNMLEISHEANI